MADSTFVSPCDGVVSEKGHITNGRMTQCKGIDYSLEKLLKKDSLKEVFLDGTYITIYLAPFNYHRVHCPGDGEILENYTIPGDLWPVNKVSVTSIDELFCVNERNISIISTPEGKYALIMVGATNVGSIELNPNIQKGNSVKKGDEYGIFNMGSTVILLFDRNLKDSLKIDSVTSAPIECLASF